MKKNILVLLNIAGLIILAFSCNHFPMRLERLDDGIILNLKSGALKVQICTDSIAKIVFDPERKFRLRKSLVVERTWEPVSFEVSSDDREIRVSTKELIILVNNKNGAVSFYDKSGKLFLNENQEKPRRLTRASVMGEKTYHIQQNFRLSQEEGVYGLGQHQEGVINYQGHDVWLVQENEKVSVLFLVSNNNL